MIKKHLIIIGLLSLSMLAVSGCAQKMAKSDDAMEPASAQAASESASPDQAAAQDTAAAEADGGTKETSAAAALPTPLPDEKSASAAKPSADESAAAQKVAATLLPLPSQEVMSTIKKMTHHPRVRYLSRTAQYDYYVGGRLEAKYDINKNQFIIKDKNASDPDAVTCKYSKDGEMISSGKSTPPKLIGECNNLVNELGTYLSR